MLSSHPCIIFLGFAKRHSLAVLHSGRGGLTASSSSLACTIVLVFAKLNNNP
jgi:hypothetical protein